MQFPAGINGVFLRLVTLTSAGFLLTSALIASGNPSAGIDATPTPVPAAADQSPASRAIIESEAGMPLEPELPQSAGLEEIGREQAATPRRIHYRVGLSVRQVYDDNINISQVNRESDLYTTIEPTIDVAVGDLEGGENFLELNYSPNAFLFASHSENDAIQHLVSLTGQYRFPLLTLNLSQTVQILDGTGLSTASGTGTDFTRTNLDVAGRTRLNVYSTRLNANYSLTGKTFLTASLGYSVSDYPSLISSSTLSGNFYVNYTYSPKLSIGLGFAGGYNLVDSPSQNQTFEQVNVRASYELTGKVSATVSAGVEFRQIENSGVQEGGSPVFDGSLFYQPFDGTTVALTFSRRTQNSATLGGQDLHSTEVILSLRQRFLQRVFVGLSVGYQNSSYFSTFVGFSATRSDDYYFLQASADLNITRFWTIGLFYFYRQSDSTLGTFSFYDNQLGLHSSLNF